MKNKVFLLLALIALCSATSAGIVYNSISPYQQLPNNVMIRSNLYLVQSDGSTILLDGDMTQYEDDFSNNLDSLDIRKMTNFSENLGQLRYSSTLAVERRTTIAEADTIFFKIWKTHQRSYQFQFIATNMEQPGLSAFLEDKYLHTKTPVSLNDSTSVNFSITADAASADPYRFRIIFVKAQMFVLPITITSFNAYREHSYVNIEWESENENGVSEFFVQKSMNGFIFSSIGSLSSKNLSSGRYLWIDNSEGQNAYYRIQSLEMDGKKTYSRVVKVNADRSSNKITIFPNPATAKDLNLKMDNQPQGNYRVSVLNSFGQCISVQAFYYSGASIVKLWLQGSIPKGMYHLYIIKPTAEKESINLIL